MRLSLLARLTAVLSGLTYALASLGRQLRRPELMVFLPAATLSAFWLGGEAALILTALGTPMVFVMAGAFRFPAATDGSGPSPRPLLRDVLDAALQSGPEGGRRVACMVVLFDDMPDLVQRHGRAAQFEVLARSAERLAATLRPGDTVVQTEGGGFAIAVTANRRLDLETVIQIATRMQAAIAPAISLDATRVHVTCSIGFCLAARAPQPTGQALLEAAQIAAEEAGRHGPSAIRAFAPDMARRHADRDAQRDALEAALDEGQIRAHFQPQLSTDTGAISGFEALARWHHPERGLLPPADFLPAIAETGLSDRLSEVMLYQALSALSRWDKTGLNVPTVAINAALSDLRDPRFAERIKWELDRFDLAPNRLNIEILETVIAETDNDVVVNTIAALARLGCGIDLDDFGTGHASITSIRRFAVNRIKIDRSFVLRADEDREQQKMLSAILSMADQLGIDTLAEGIETPGAHAMLAQLGCRHVQGYAIARPMPLEDSFAWIRRHQDHQTALPRIGHRAR